MGRKRGKSAHLWKVGNARRLEKHGHRALSKLWRLHAPSEGETKKGESCTPSEGGRRWKEDKVYDERACGRGQAECDSATALNRGICCRCGNGTEGQGRTEGLQKGRGDESHTATPLWERDGGAMPFRRPAERTRRRKPCRNGTESRNLLPLWKRDGKLLLFLRTKIRI